MRRFIYYPFVLISLVILLFSLYKILDNMKILMYAPENWKASVDIYETQYYKSIQHIMEIYIYIILYLTIQIIISTFVFIITKKKKNG